MHETIHIEPSPLVTVLMAVHNGAQFVKEATESILDQSFASFEFVVVDDYSSDDSITIIRNYRDPRIRILQNEENLGLAASLNRGLRLAQGKYIARMDADDISHPTRIETQVRFMERHPKVGVCGTWVQTFGRGNDLVWSYPADSASIKCALLFECPFAHPSVMLRQSALLNDDLHYNESFRIAQDYQLWVHLASVTEFANIPEVLYRYRLHNRQAGYLKSSEQILTARLIRRLLLEALVVNLAEEDEAIHEALCLRSYEPSQQFVEKAEHWMLKLRELNKGRQSYSDPDFNRELANRWLEVCLNSKHLGPWVFRKYLASPLQSGNCTSFWSKLRFLRDCCISAKYLERCK